MAMRRWVGGGDALQRLVDADDAAAAAAAVAAGSASAALRGLQPLDGAASSLQPTAITGSTAVATTTLSEALSAARVDAEVEDGGEVGAGAAANTEIIPWGANVRELSKPKLFSPPRQGKWSFLYFQTYTYTNVIRWIAFFHLLLGVVALALAETRHHVACAVVLWYLLVDVGLFIVTGCPLSYGRTDAHCLSA